MHVHPDTDGPLSGFDRLNVREGVKAVVNLYRRRLELLFLDLEEEKERLAIGVILWALAGLLLGLGCVAGSAFIVAVLWPYWGGWALVALSAAYFVAAGIVIAALRKFDRGRHRTFAFTLQEFEKDADSFAKIFSGPGREARRPFDSNRMP